jgi:hypothetical protein
MKHWQRTRREGCGILNLSQEAHCMVKGSFGLKSQPGGKSVNELEMPIGLQLHWLQWELQRSVMPMLSNESNANQKAVKALLNERTAAVRIGEKPMSFTSTLQQLRQSKTQEGEQGVDKLTRARMENLSKGKINPCSSHHRGATSLPHHHLFIR